VSATATQTAWQLTKTSNGTIYLTPAGTKVAYGVKTISLGTGLAAAQNNIVSALNQLHPTTDQSSLLISSVLRGQIGSMPVPLVADSLHWLSSSLVAGLGVAAVVEAAGGAGAAADAASVDAATGATAAEGGAAGAAGGTVASKVASGAASGAAKTVTSDLGQAAAIAGIGTFLAKFTGWTAIRLLELVGGLVLAYLAVRQLASVGGAPGGLGVAG